MRNPRQQDEEAPLWFSRSKTRAPQFDVELVDRVRLLVVLDEAIQKPLSCVVAPAGFGKSTLLLQWNRLLSERGVPCAWVNLDENDKEIRTFVAYLIFALKSVQIDLGQLQKIAERGFIDMSSQAVVASLFSALDGVQDRFVLVLDDFHRAECQEVNSLIHDLVDQFGDKMHISIGSRNSVDIGMARYLASGRAVEVSAAMLRFSDREVQKAIGDRFDNKAVAAIQSKVEGWPVAVQLAKLANSSGDNTGKSPDFGATDNHMARYLVSEVLSTQRKDIQAFLLTTSVLDSFNASLADAVCQHQISGSLIVEMEAISVLVIPLDEHSEWFRYHHLFSTCLAETFKAQNLESFIKAHRRAAAWCAKNKMVDEAVSYAATIQDYDLARQIINENSIWMRREQFGGIGYLDRVLNKIPENELVKDPMTLTAKIHACTMKGDSKSALMYNNVAKELIQKSGTTPENFVDRLITETGLQAQVEFDRQRDGGWLNDRLKLADAIAKKHPESRSVSGMIRTIIANQRLSYGDKDEAASLADIARADLEGVQLSPVNLYNGICIALIDLWSNLPLRSRAQLTKTAQEAQDQFGAESNIRTVCEMFSRSIDYWQSSPSACIDRTLEAAVMKSAQTGGGYDVYSIGFDAVVHDALSNDDPSLALSHIQTLESWIHRLTIRRLEQLVEVLKLECAVGSQSKSEAAGLFASIGRWTDAEDSEVENLGWSLRVMAFHACARYLRFVGRYHEALDYAELGLQETRPLDIALFTVRGELLRASILDRMNQSQPAIDAVTSAVIEGSRISTIRPFGFDIPTDLLEAGIKKLLQRGTSTEAIDFAQQISYSLLPDQFSTRELDVLKLMSHGKSNKEIAREIAVSPNTVKFHLKNVFEKLGVNNRIEATKAARLRKIIL